MKIMMDEFDHLSKTAVILKSPIANLSNFLSKTILGGSEILFLKLR